MLVLAVVAALVGAGRAGVDANTASVWLFPPLVIALLAMRGMYQPKIRVQTIDEAGHVVAATSVAAMVIIAFSAFLTDAGEHAELLARVWVFGSVYVTGSRILLGYTQRHARVERLVGTPTLIVGAGRVGAQVERRLDEQPELGLRAIGFVDAHPPTQDLVPGRRAPVLGGPADLARIVAETGAEHVVLAFLSSRGSDAKLVPLVRECDELGLEVSLVPRLWESINVRVSMEHIGGMPLFRLRTIKPKGWQFAIKHGLDRVTAAALILLLSPLLIGVTLAVRLSSSGPIFFRQRRIGRDGRAFDLLKFRSMRIDAPADPAPAGNVSVLLPEETAPGGVEGADRRTAHRQVPAPLVDRRAAAALQRPEGPDVDHRPASRAARVRRAVRAPHRPLRRPPPRQVGHHRLGAGPRPARQDVPLRPDRVGQLLHRELVALAGPQDPADDRYRGPQDRRVVQIQRRRSRRFSDLPASSAAGPRSRGSSTPTSRIRR